MANDRTAFLKLISRESKARELMWSSRFGGKTFICPFCSGTFFWQHKNRPEVRECRHCHHQIRLRAGTILRDSKTPISTWLKALYHLVRSKGDLSANELNRRIQIGSYRTAWAMVHKIRRSLKGSWARGGPGSRDLPMRVLLKTSAERGKNIGKSLRAQKTSRRKIA